MYYINYHTGAGNFEVDDDIEAAMELADEGAEYTQENISIEDKNHNELYVRQWYGLSYNSEYDSEDPIQFGNFGYYDDWIEI